MFENYKKYQNEIIKELKNATGGGGGIYGVKFFNNIDNTLPTEGIETYDTGIIKTTQHPYQLVEKTDTGWRNIDYTNETVFMAYDPIAYNGTIWSINPEYKIQIFKIIESSPGVITLVPILIKYISDLKYFKMGLENGNWAKSLVNPVSIDIPYANTGLIKKLNDLITGDRIDNISIQMPPETELANGSNGYITIYNMDSIKPDNRLIISAVRSIDSPDFGKIINIALVGDSDNRYTYLMELVNDVNYIESFDNAEATWDKSTRILKLKKMFKVNYISETDITINDTWFGTADIFNFAYNDIGIIKPESNTLIIDNGHIEVASSVGGGYSGSFDIVKEDVNTFPSPDRVNMLALDIKTNKIYLSADNLQTKKWSELTPATDSADKLVAIKAITTVPIPDGTSPSVFRTLRLNKTNSLASYIGSFQPLGQTGDNKMGIYETPTKTENMWYNGAWEITNIIPTETPYIQSILNAGNLPAAWQDYLQNAFQFIFSHPGGGTLEWEEVGSLEPIHGNIIIEYGTTMIMTSTGNTPGSSNNNIVWMYDNETKWTRCDPVTPTWTVSVTSTVLVSLANQDYKFGDFADTSIGNTASKHDRGLRLDDPVVLYGANNKVGFGNITYIHPNPQNTDDIRVYVYFVGTSEA